MDGKRIRCLQIASQHVPIYLQQFPSYSNRKCKKSLFSRTAAHIFVSPGDARGSITLNVVWMERKFDAYKLSRRMYQSMFNSFPVIRTASAKNRHFHVPPPTFLFPMQTLLRLSRKQASIFICPINKHKDIISMNNVEGQAARKAHKAQHCWPPCKKIKNKKI